MPVASIVLGLALSVQAAPPVAASQQAKPSFDCTQASGQVQKLICGDPELAQIDRRLADVYAQATASWPANITSEQRSMQRGWIKGRDDCWKSDDVRACVLQQYRSRIVELQIKSGQLTASTPIGWSCTGGEGGPVTTVFYQTTEPASVVLTVGTGQVIAFAVPSGSGAKYAAPSVEFWEQQAEATVAWFGTTLTCRRHDAPAVHLAGTAWQLLEFQSMDDTILKPGVTEKYSLTFQADGQLLVQASCNRGQGSWNSKDNVSLSLGPVALTRAMCPPSTLEHRFVRDLQYVRSYVIRDGQLHLSLMADGGIYSFEPIPPQH